ncbi:unnamed protein product [Trichobilharzia szidati]|nr:unnamed protein product [Trichobilharzia szidati]
MTPIHPFLHTPEASCFYFSTSQWKSTCDLDEDLNSSTDGVIPLTQGISAFRRKSSSLINKPQMLSHSSTASSYVSLPASNNGLNQTKSNNYTNNKHGFDRQTVPTRPTATSLPQSSRNSMHFETINDKSVDDNFHRRRASAFSTPSSSNMTLTFLKDFNNKRTGAIQSDQLPQISKTTSKHQRDTSSRKSDEPLTADSNPTLTADPNSCDIDIKTEENTVTSRPGSIHLDSSTNGSPKSKIPLPQRNSLADSSSHHRIDDSNNTVNTTINNDVDENDNKEKDFNNNNNNNNNNDNDESR